MSMALTAANLLYEDKIKRLELELEIFKNALSRECLHCVREHDPSCDKKSCPSIEFWEDEIYKKSQEIRRLDLECLEKDDNLLTWLN